MRLKKILKTTLCVFTAALTLVTSAVSLQGCGKKDAAGQNETADEGSSGNAGPSLDDTINGWKKNSEAEYNRRMQALYEVLQPMWADECEYRSAWDLSELYTDEKDFRADYDEVEDWITSLKDFEGTLDNKESINAYFRAIEDEEMNEKYNTMLMYCELGESLDLKDDYYSNLSEELKDLENDFAKATSYAQPEIMELPFETRKEIFEDPIFDDMSYYLRYYSLEDSYSFSREEKEEIADLERDQGQGLDDYEQFRYVDFPAADFTMPDGTEVKLTGDEYTAIIQGSYDRDVKADAYIAYEESFKKQADVFAGFLQTTMEEKWEEAKRYGYDTTLDMALDEEYLGREVFDNVIKAANDASSDYARYISLHKSALSIDEQYMFDLDTSASDISEPIFPYDDTIELVKKSTEVLGSDYATILDEIVSGDYIDTELGENREGSSYCMGAGKRNMPRIFTNFYGEYTDASNLSHELGHAVNYRMTAQNQPIWYTDVSIFDTEVCSIMHELLLNAYLVDNADSDGKRLYYLEKLLDIYDSAFFSQCMYSELEDYMYGIVENGGTLKGSDINKKMGELFVKYRGSDIYCEDSAWCCIDHLHYGYYMYKYATSICYASALVQDILDGDEETIEAYKTFMKSGSSDDPAELLKLAGIDPYSAETYAAAGEYYASLVDEYEELLSKQ